MLRLRLRLPVRVRVRVSVRVRVRVRVTLTLSPPASAMCAQACRRTAHVRHRCRYAGLSLVFCLGLGR